MYIHFEIQMYILPNNYLFHINIFLISTEK